MPQTLGELFTSVVGGLPGAEDLNAKASTANPVFTGSISLNRKVDTTVGTASVAIGTDATASNSWAVAIGYMPTASGSYSIAMGRSPNALDSCAIAMGDHVNASGARSIAMGAYNTSMTNFSSWVANTEYTKGDIIKKNSYTYRCITANNDSTFDSDKWVVIPYSTIQAFVIGNGAYSGRSNALTLEWSGDLHLAGDVYTGANADGTGGTKLGAVDTSALAPKASPEFTGSISLGRKDSTTVGTASSAIGYTVEASGNYSHAEGYYTTASGNYGSHAEGNYTTASGKYSHAEGSSTTANGSMTHASGSYNQLMQSIPNWTANTQYNVNDLVLNSSYYRCIEANNDSVFDSTKWEGVPWDTIQTFVVGNGIDSSHKSNALTLDWSGDLHLKGDVYTGANANGTGGTKLDTSTLAPKASPAFTGSISLGRKADTTVGNNSFAVGNNVTASGQYSHAEGNGSKATSVYAHAEGYDSKASGSTTHAEGYQTEANGAYSHAEGNNTLASGISTHASGAYNAKMQSIPAWVENTTYAIGDLIKKGFSYYKCIEANSDAEFTSSKWKTVNQSTIQAFVVGNGTDLNDKSNALTLDWTGDLHLARDVYVNANADGTGGSKVATEAFVTTRVPAPPVSDGTYILQCVVSSGVPTYSWISASS